MRRIKVGSFRDDSSGPMQVVSGPVGQERVHFEALAAARLDGEMRAFLDWFNGNAETDWVVKASLAHLWFVTIHPFDDGNGRIGRAISDLALTRSEQSSQRFYSMSAQIQQERTAYYDTLELTQKGTIDITLWMNWYLGCLSRAVIRVQGARPAKQIEIEPGSGIATGKHPPPAVQHAVQLLGGLAVQDTRKEPP